MLNIGIVGAGVGASVGAGVGAGVGTGDGSISQQSSTGLYPLGQMAEALSLVSD